MPELLYDVDDAIDALDHNDSIALDIETSGLDPRLDYAAVISLCGLRHDHVAVIHTPKGDIPRRLIDWLNTKELITHNGTNFDLMFLAKSGLKPRRHYDTLIGELVLRTDGSWAVKNDLGSVMKRRLGKSFKLDIDHRTWVAPTLTHNQLAYAASDVEWLHELQDIQKGEAHVRGLTEALDKEQKLTLIVVEIQKVGMPVDFEKFNDLYDAESVRLAKAQSSLDDLTGGFNARSHTQVKAVIEKECGIKLANTRAETLGLLANVYPLVSDIMDVRKAAKRTSMFSDTWLARHAPFGRIYSTYRQIGTDTRRFSSKDPNLQQIPKVWRAAFGGVSGRKIITADWSQLELRIAAHIYDDNDLRNALASDDLHLAMASAMYSMPPDKISKEIRNRGKAGTFTYFFGGGANGITSAAAKWGTEIERGDAFLMLRRLARSFPKTEAYLRKLRALARRKKLHVLNMPWGHQRIVHAGKNKYGTSLPVPVLSNTPIQGTAAIGLKETLFECERRGLLKHIAALVHDEIVAVDVPDADVADYTGELNEAMVVGMAKVCPSVPIFADIETARNWG